MGQESRSGDHHLNSGSCSVAGVPGAKSSASTDRFDGTSKLPVIAIIACVIVLVVAAVWLFVSLIRAPQDAATTAGAVIQAQGSASNGGSAVVGPQGSASQESSVAKQGETNGDSSTNSADGDTYDYSTGQAVSTAESGSDSAQTGDVAPD